MNNIDIQNAIRLVKVQFPILHINSSEFMNENLTEELNMNIDYRILFPSSKTFVVEFKTKLFNKVGSFNAEIIMMALFEANDEMDDAFKDSFFVRINAPAIAFPFLRSFISTVSVNAGFKPIIIPSLNFSKSL